jgi:hypothetical protein
LPEAIFTPEERTRLRSELLEYAACDRRVSAAAITGSAAAEREDEWSDIDIALGVDDASEVQSVLADWTAYMYDRHAALHLLDIKTGSWIYRVFLLPSTLQVDLAFVPATEFRALGPTFRLMFGEAKEPRNPAPPQPMEIVGLGWLYALHARSCIARKKLWQAEYMISGTRDQALALACIRHSLPPVHGRGIDQLPLKVTAPFEGSLIRQMDALELARAFRIVVQILLAETRSVNHDLAEHLEETVTRLSDIFS